MIKVEVSGELGPTLERLTGKINVPEGTDVSIVEMKAESSEKVRPGGRVGGSEGVRIMYFNSLRDILFRASSGETIVVIGDQRRSEIADIPEWQGIMGYPNVSYCETRNLFKQLPASANEAVNQTRPRNEIAIQLAETDTPQSIVRGLRHAANAIKRGGGLSKTDDEWHNNWRREARAAFGDLSDDELIEKAINADVEEAKPIFEGRKLDAAFFDIEGTLIQQGEVNQDLVTELNRVSQELPVIVWTDGDLENAKTLREAGVLCPVRPKSIFAGASVAKAYDDKQEDDLKQEFRISVDEFHHVSDMHEEELREGGPGGPEHE